MSSSLRRLARAVVRSLVALTPRRLTSVILDEAVRRLHAVGPDFVTIRLRPKSGASTVYAPLDSIPTRATDRIAIVIQGPLSNTDHFTAETVRFYRSCVPDAAVIVSTWRSESTERLQELENLGAHVVVAEKPKLCGRLNVNLQVATTHQGLQRAQELGCTHAAKTRSDQRFYAAHYIATLADVARSFPVEHERPRERIVSISRWTSKFCPHHLSDQFMFGRVDDLLDYWSPPLDTTTLDRKDFDSHVASVKHLSGYDQTPEQYLFRSYLNKIGCEAMPTLELWWRVLASRFVILDASVLDAYWPKYQPHDEIAELASEGYSAGTVMRYLDWHRLHALLRNGDSLDLSIPACGVNDRLPLFLRKTNARMEAASIAEESGRT